VTDSTPDSATHSRKPVLLTWQGVRAASLESARLLVSDGRLRASGRLVSAAAPVYGTEAFNASYELTASNSGTVAKVLVRTTTADEERQIMLGRTDDGVWLIDHGQGAERDEFDGAADVDVAGAVAFNTLPIRRLGLHREPGEHELPVLFVSLPDLTVTLVRQTYRTVRVTDNGAVVNYTDADISADLTVDADGLVIDYPDLSRLV
jgi:uncharacterized protein